MRDEKINGIYTGYSHTIQREIASEIVEAFAKLSGDFNPVHMDDDFCLRHGLNSRIVHGMLVLSLVSALIGMHLPGEGAVWLSQSFDFISPARIGDILTVKGLVTGIHSGNLMGLDILEMKIEITNQEKRRIARGNVKVSMK